jgi:hypothetical protein
MSVIQRLVDDLRAIEGEWLNASDAAALEPACVAQRLHRVVAMLADEEARWVGTTAAKRLLGLSSENTVKAWARSGLLQSRTRPNGRVQILLDDVLERRTESEESDRRRRRRALARRAAPAAEDAARHEPLGATGERGNAVDGRPATIGNRHAVGS